MLNFTVPNFPERAKRIFEAEGSEGDHFGAISPKMLEAIETLRQGVKEALFVDKSTKDTSSEVPFVDRTPATEHCLSEAGRRKKGREISF